LGLKNRLICSSNKTIIYPPSSNKKKVFIETIPKISITKQEFFQSIDSKKFNKPGQGKEEHTSAQQQKKFFKAYLRGTEQRKKKIEP
jgi:hypothetical protein